MLHLNFFKDKLFNVLQEFLMAVSNDTKVIPALRDQLTKLEIIVKQK